MLNEIFAVIPCAAVETTFGGNDLDRLFHLTPKRGSTMVRVRLLWASGRRTDVEVESALRAIQYRGPNRVTSFYDTGAHDPDGRHTYAEAGCRWTRLHVDHIIGSVIVTERGMFGAMSEREGQVTLSGTYHALALAKAAADLDARCRTCRCAPWVSDQHRSVHVS